MDTQLILCSHGQFAEALVSSAEMIAGKMPNVHVFSLLPGMSMEDFRNRIVKKMEEIGLDQNYLCLIDLYGGTPCTTILSLMKDYHIDVVTGLNLAMLIEVYTSIQFQGDQDVATLAFDTLKASGHKILHNEIHL